jgi:(+)-trans-carveol dehydrogenase
MINLTGVWHTVKAAIAHLRATGGGSVIITNSVSGLKGAPNLAHYSSAEHGLVGLGGRLQRRAVLASDEARYITGVTLPVDAGSFVK